MRNLLRHILPNFIINYYKKQKSIVKHNERLKLLESKQITTKALIESELKKIGVVPGDTIMLHSSLSKMGMVENGSDDVIDAFLNIIGNEGTLMMPAFPAMGFSYDYLKSNPVFDIKNTPSKMGIVTEVFRKRVGVLRSLHPTDSVCAIGKNANYLIKDHFNQITPYNQYSPFYKLVELNAKIVLLGVDLNSLTNFHTLEDAVENFKFPVYHPTEFKTQLKDENGVLQTMLTKVHNPEYSKKRQCNAFIKPFIDAGLMKSFTLGLATCYVIEANHLHNWMLDNYKSKGITLYTPQGS